MSTNKQSRRAFLTQTTAIAALGATTATGFGQSSNDKISHATIAQAEQLAGIQFSEKEREQILRTIEEQHSLFTARMAFGDIPNSLSPATVFHPRVPGRTVHRYTNTGNVRDTLPSAGPCPRSNEELAFAPVWKLSHWMKQREITSMQLTSISLERLKKYGPSLQCVISLTEERALRQAKQADAELDAGLYKGPLHGIPWGAKDIIDTAGDKTTWGAMAYKDRISHDNAFVTQKLEDSGAVLVAKLALGALAYGDVWFGGTCKNPFDVHEGSSGSSAGSACATAAGLVPFSLGTETYGSIVSPCMRCGATGLRPTFGRVARTGVMALCWSLDKIGPICRSVLDTALVLDAINGEDAGDPSSVQEPFYFDSSQSAKGIRLGFDPGMMDNKENKYDLEALYAAEKSGAILVEAPIPDLDPTVMLIPLLAESAAAFEEFTRSGDDDELVWQDDAAWPNSFRQAWFIPAIEHIQASRLRRKMQEQMHTWMNESFDAFLTPSFSNLLLLTNGTGHPSLVLRTGMPHGKPTGTTLIGRLFDEGTICRLGMAMESKLDVSGIRPSFSM